MGAPQRFSALIALLYQSGYCRKILHAFSLCFGGGTVAQPDNWSNKKPNSNSKIALIAASKETLMKQNI
jgi:hypothetical protein